jgi:putative hydrolase of the HAD superfamily
MIKHVSFDLWNTLIKSDPNFSETRAKFLSEVSGKHKEEVHTVIRAVSFAHDKECMKTGYHKATSVQMYEEVLKKLGMNTSEASVQYVVEVCTRTLNLNPPVFICPHTLEILEDIKSKGITMSILSNTGFVNGSMLRPILTKLGLYHYMDYSSTYGGVYFSDELRRAKPNASLFSFTAIVHRAAEGEVLHIGDSAEADGGASTVGCQFLLTETGIDKLIPTIDMINGHLIEEK